MGRRLTLRSVCAVQNSTAMSQKFRATRAAHISIRVSRIARDTRQESFLYPLHDSLMRSPSYMRRAALPN